MGKVNRARTAARHAANAAKALNNGDPTKANKLADKADKASKSLVDEATQAAEESLGQAERRFSQFGAAVGAVSGGAYDNAAEVEAFLNQVVEGVALDNKHASVGSKAVVGEELDEDEQADLIVKQAMAEAKSARLIEALNALPTARNALSTANAPIDGDAADEAAFAEPEKEADNDNYSSDADSEDEEEALKQEAEVLETEVDKEEQSGVAGDLLDSVTSANPKGAGVNTEGSPNPQQQRDTLDNPTGVAGDLLDSVTSANPNEAGVNTEGSPNPQQQRDTLDNPTSSDAESFLWVVVNIILAVMGFGVNFESKAHTQQTQKRTTPEENAEKDGVAQQNEIANARVDSQSPTPKEPATSPSQGEMGRAAGGITFAPGPAFVPNESVANNQAPTPKEPATPPSQGEMGRAAGGITSAPGPVFVPTTPITAPAQRERPASAPKEGLGSSSQNDLSRRTPTWQKTQGRPMIEAMKAMQDNLKQAQGYLKELKEDRAGKSIDSGARRGPK